MKYWLLTTEYPPLFGGGISTYCYHTANMFTEKGYEVTVFIPDDAIKNYKIEIENSIRIIRFNTCRTGMQNYLGYVPNMAYAFAAIIKYFIQKEGKPGCIESQEYLAIAYYVLQFKLLKYPEFENVPIILSLHSPAFLYLEYNREGIYSFPNYWIGEMEKSCIQCADYIIAPSQYIIEEIKKHTSIDETKTAVIHNPYNFQQSNNNTFKNIVRNKMIFFGKLSPQKGVFELFVYLKNLWDDGFKNTLTVIGGTDKVYYPEMKTMGQIIHDKYSGYIKKGLIKFVGKIAPERKSVYLSDAHVIIIPSLNDNLPYAAIEAMSLGKVILTSIQGGQKEIIEDGINGFLFDHERPETFAEKLNHILSLNDNGLKKIGDAAVEKIISLLNYETIYLKKNSLIKTIISKNTVNDFFPFINAAYPFIETKNDNNNGLLSIVIPYFNMGDYIPECVESILSSSYQNIEIFIINDGSTEQKSIDLLKQFEQHQKIKIINKKNEGLAETRNYGAKIAKGEFLAFLDADDKVDSTYYSKVINVMKQYQNVFFVGAWVKYFGTKKDVWPTWNPEPPYILLHNSVNSSSLVYKKNAFLQGGLFDKKVDYGIEDYESVVNMLQHGYGGVVLPECLFFYRVRKDSMYRSLTHYKTLYSYQYIADKHADFYSKFATKIFNLLNANGPSFAYDNPSFEMKVSSSNVYPDSSVNKIKSIIKKNPALKKLLLSVANILKLK